MKKKLPIIAVASVFLLVAMAIMSSLIAARRFAARYWDEWEQKEGPAGWTYHATRIEFSGGRFWKPYWEVCYRNEKNEDEFLSVGLFGKEHTGEL
ncbi:MAG: hypothetical protein R6V03_09765 [Kiritimatiellia bacterium]